MSKKFDVAILFGLAHQSVESHATREQLADALRPIMASGDLLDCIKTYCTADKAKAAADGSMGSAVERARALLEKSDVDVADYDAVHAAIEPGFWKSEGYKGTQSLKAPKAVPEDSPADVLATFTKNQAAYDAFKPQYNAIKKRIERMAKAICGIEAAQEEIVVPRALLALMKDAAKLYSRKQVNKAVAKAFAKAKAAK